MLSLPVVEDSVDHPIWNSKIYKILYSFEYSIFIFIALFFLFAGGCATTASVDSGAFTFAVSDLPSLTVWNLGSARLMAPCWWMC